MTAWSNEKGIASLIVTFRIKYISQPQVPQTWNLLRVQICR